MKKNQYIAPAIEVSTIVIESHLMDSSPVNPNGSNSFSNATEGAEREEGDVKRGYNVWDDDWSR